MRGRSEANSTSVEILEQELCRFSIGVSGKSEVFNGFVSAERILSVLPVRFRLEMNSKQFGKQRCIL
jgi:hypothetical protein